MTDKDFLLAVLSDGREHSLNEILARSFSERGCGLTPHSRAADLRRDGFTILNRPVGTDRRGSVYQLVPKLVPALTPMPSPAAEAPRLEADGSYMAVGQLTFEEVLA